MRVAWLSFADAEKVDPRVLMTRVERGVRAVASTAIGSPPWICITALLCSAPVGFFGNIPLDHAVICIATVTAASLFVLFALKWLERRLPRRGGPRLTKLWTRLVLGLAVLMSTVWGLVPWVLWQPGNLVNHAVIELISLSIVARFLVSRAGHIEFLMASFGPMATLLFARFVIELSVPDLLLGALIPFYALHLALDANRHTERIDSDAYLRFLNEDMARELGEARDEAMRKRREAEEANASKTKFLANMSHELRTPLNAILGFSEIIARECLGPVGSPRYKEYAGDIHNSGSHLLSLINDLLDVAKIEAGKMEIEPNMIETARSLETALKFVAVRAYERGQTLTIDVAPAAQNIIADERALKQIVINLVANAVKFTPSGGRIVVEARRNEGGDFEMMIGDDGPGIPQEKIDQIFQPFAQIDNRYDRKAGGTGLGLALVRGLVDLHGGRVWLESGPDMGTRVFVSLPQASSLSQCALA